MSAKADIREGAILHRKYDFSFGGKSGTLAISLGQPEADNMPGRFARQMGAHAYGLVSIIGLEAAPRFPVVWVLFDNKVGLTVTGDDELTVDLKRLIARHVGKFFADIEPEIGALGLKLNVPTGRTLY
ncbi:hypothetical protein [Reyranella sp.]|uniref:hypothetical protein n=1 Tax=Reyranella sp. TaxID=1929291 RepID=UPI003D0A3D24